MQTISEDRRLSALRELDVLDVDVDLRFELMTMAARQLFDVPYACITLVDADRQYRVARSGPVEQEGPLEGAICPHAMWSDDLFVVPDTRQDPRFADSPYVLGEPHLRFYAGWPLTARRGEPIGSFCIMDVRPRRLSDADRGALADLGRWVQEELLAGVQPVG
jgi:GAF domain-containing protein